MRPVLVVPLVAFPLGLAGCTTEPATPVPPDPVVHPEPAPRERLAAVAAAAQDRRFTADYRLETGDQPARRVAVTRAVDGSWRVDIPRGALGGTADIAVADTGAGRYQCSLELPGGPPEPMTGPTASPMTAPSAGPTTGPTAGPTTGPTAGPTGGPAPELGMEPIARGPACIQVAEPAGRLPFTIDPRIQLPFTDWLEVLSDRRAPLSVSLATAPPGVAGTCFSIESTSVSLAAPLDPGLYCFSADGILTEARLSLGRLSLAAPPAAGPATVRLPGPIVAGYPLTMAAPTPVTPSTTAT